MPNTVTIDENSRSADIKIKDSSNAVVNPAKEDGNLATLNTTVSTTSFDTISKNIIVIQHSHDEVHSGDVFMSHALSTLGASGTTSFLVSTGSSTAHAIHKVSTDQAVSVVVSETPTITSNGSTTGIYNKNRASSNTTAVIVYTSPVTTAAGTMIHEELVGASKTSGQNRGLDEIIYKPDTYYLIALQNLTNQTANYSFEVDWYEK